MGGTGASSRKSINGASSGTVAVIGGGAITGGSAEKSNTSLSRKDGT
jgi:deoxyxylulose-5-phosphate synthase